MDRHCRCGDDGALATLGCLDCGAVCCPACVIQLESTAYCARCASALLETATVRASGPFTLH